jgi:plasmid stabilization system protein ParE
MSRRIERSRAALADFDALYDYIARENPRADAQVLSWAVKCDTQVQRLKGRTTKRRFDR